MDMRESCGFLPGGLRAGRIYNHRNQTGRGMPGIPRRPQPSARSRIAVMDEETVMAVLDLMDDEMIFEWSYRLRTDDRTDATELYALVRGYLDHAFPT